MSKIEGRPDSVKLLARFKPDAPAPRELFNAETYKALYGDRTVQVLGQGHVFRKNFHTASGLLVQQLPVHCFKIVTPPSLHEEPLLFVWWEAFRDLRMSLTLNCEQTLSPGERVRLSTGQQTGLCGEVLESSDGIARVRIPQAAGFAAEGLVKTAPGSTSSEIPGTILSVPIQDLQRVIQIGDLLRVKTGRYVGQIGLVTDVTGRNICIASRSGESSNKIEQLVRLLISCMAQYLCTLSMFSSTMSNIVQMWKLHRET